MNNEVTNNDSFFNLLNLAATTRVKGNENFWFCFKCDREIPREVKVKKKKIPILSLFSTEL